MSLVNTGSIKNLSIALEALSRINHPAAGNMFEAVEQLLDEAISKERKEHVQDSSDDDDIPF